MLQERLQTLFITTPTKAELEAADVRIIADIEKWSQAHSGQLPQHSRTDRQECALRKKLERLMQKAAHPETKSSLLADRLKLLQSVARKTPTKKSSRGGTYLQRKVKSATLLARRKHCRVP